MRSWHRSCLCPPCGHATSWERCTRSSTGFWHRVGIYPAASIAGALSPTLRPLLVEVAGGASRARTRSSAIAVAGRTIIIIIGSKGLPNAVSHTPPITAAFVHLLSERLDGTFVDPLRFFDGHETFGVSIGDEHAPDLRQCLSGLRGAEAFQRSRFFERVQSEALRRYRGIDA